MHRKSFHREVLYPCNQCKFIGSSSVNLVRHKNNNHKVVWNFCDQCFFKASTILALEKHKEIKHTVIKLSDDERDTSQVHTSDVNVQDLITNDLTSLVNYATERMDNSGNISSEKLKTRKIIYFFNFLIA